jgi:hypothetical protein
VFTGCKGDNINKQNSQDGLVTFIDRTHINIATTRVSIYGNRFTLHAVNPWRVQDDAVKFKPQQPDRSVIQPQA